MLGEILSLETAEKLAKLEKIKEYIEQLPFNDLVPLEIKVIHKILEGNHE